MSPSDTIALVNLVLTVLMGIGGWVVSWRIADRQLASSLPDKTGAARSPNRTGVRLRKPTLYLSALTGAVSFGLLTHTLFFRTFPNGIHKLHLLGVVMNTSTFWVSVVMASEYFLQKPRK